MLLFACCGNSVLFVNVPIDDNAVFVVRCGGITSVLYVMLLSQYIFYIYDTVLMLFSACRNAVFLLSVLVLLMYVVVLLLLIYCIWSRNCCFVVFLAAASVLYELRISAKIATFCTSLPQ